MPVYRGDHVDQAARAFRSVTQDQVLAPAQVVVVRDGPVPARLGALLDGWAAAGAATVVVLPRNRGLAAALNAGLEACRFGVVARQDADDVSYPARFARQVPLVAGGRLDLVGGWMREFNQAPGDLGEAVRTYPSGEVAIRRMARLANPLAHPTVVFRRDAVLAAGGYREFHHLEDYELWTRLLQAGARVGNVPEPLVNYRVSAAAYRRRGGAKTLRAEWDLQRELRRSGFAGPVARWRNLAVRGGFEVAPLWLRRLALSRLLSP
jgi:glycosyltransferase involved in cell wall biosynthesis